MKNKIKNITIGCDPELFLEKNNKIISAVGLIGGSKHDPKPISEKGHAIQEDNVLIEFCIPPSKTVEDFTDNINFVKNYLEVITAGMGCNLNYSASAILEESELESDQAKEFGCEPDFNVYTQSMNNPPDSKTNMRSAGGHIHIGFDKENISDEEDEEIIMKLVKAMDLTVGLQSLILDKDDRRKELYGKAGCFRFKPYGMEYRTPSNFWIENNYLINWAWNATMLAIDLVNSGKIDLISEEEFNIVVDVINNNKKDEALKLIEKYKYSELELI